MAADVSLSLVITDPGDAGAIDNTSIGTCRLVTSGAETRTLAAPTAIGPEVFLVMETDGGDCVVTVGGSGYDESGNSTLTFSAVGQCALLKAATESTGTFCWRLISYDGVTGPSLGIDDLTLVDLTATTITVSGASGLQNVTASGTMGISGATTTAGITDSATIAGTNQTLSGTLGVTGATTLTTVTATGAATLLSATLSSTLDVDGTTTLDTTEVDGTLTMKDGGTATQTTSTTTTVVLNTNSGQITTFTSTLAAGSSESFTVTNTNVAANDTILLHLGSTSSAGTPEPVVASVGSGSFVVRMYNRHSSAALNNTSVINFNVIKGSTS